MVIPVLNEAATISQVVATCIAADPAEVLVIDADSTDNSAELAREAGAIVHNWREIVDRPVHVGKGESLWRGTLQARGEAVVFIDGDLESLTPEVIGDLARPILSDPEIQLVKASYTRTLHGVPSEGGRVTQLSAKPLLRALFPELGTIRQPLGGEYAIRRSAALTLPFVVDYGVEVGLLIDVYRDYGLHAITEVGVADRVHRNRPLRELAAMADQVSATILSRAGITHHLPEPLQVQADPGLLVDFAPA